MQKIKTNWEFDIGMETLRLIETSYLTVTNAYREKGFYVLPINQKKSRTRDYSEILLPELPYQEVSRYWQRVKKINYAPFPINPSFTLVTETRKLISSTLLAEPISCAVKEKLWDSINPEATVFLQRLLPKGKGIKEITIYHTRIGSKVTFNRSNENPFIVKMYLREDAGIYHLLYGLITSITRHEVFKNLLGNWESSQILSDWLLEYTALSDILAKHNIKSEPLMKSLKSKQKAFLELESSRYLLKLGLFSEDFTYTVDSENIYINSKKITNLTPSNKKLFIHLIHNRGCVLDIETLGKVLFPDDEDFSLYAISKQVQRLRNKLEQNGLPSNIIITKRGGGIMLK